MAKTKADLIASLGQFTLGYIEAALWCGIVHEEDSGTEERNYDIDDISAKALHEMIEDCTDFQAANRTDLIAARSTANTPAQQGHDFYLTRNRHGAGFWDRGLGEVGDRLAKAAHAYGDSSLALHRGKLYTA